MEGLLLLTDYLGGTGLDKTLAFQLISLSRLSLDERRRIYHRVLATINLQLATSPLHLAVAA